MRYLIPALFAALVSTSAMAIEPFAIYSLVCSGPDGNKVLAVHEVYTPPVGELPDRETVFVPSLTLGGGD